MKSGKTPAAGIAFGVALVSLMISSVLFFQMQGLRGKTTEQLAECSFHLHRTGALLETLGISLEPGPGYESLNLTWPPTALRSDAARALDQSRVAVALGQLRNIQMAFVMRMTEEERFGYPPSSTIRSYADFREILLDYAFLPADPLEKGWIFLGYLRPSPDTFLLVTEARNQERTLIMITPEQITPWHATP